MHQFIRDTYPDHREFDAISSDHMVITRRSLDLQMRLEIDARSISEELTGTENFSKKKSRRW